MFEYLNIFLHLNLGILLHYSDLHYNLALFSYFALIAVLTITVCTHLFCKIHLNKEFLCTPVYMTII